MLVVNFALFDTYASDRCSDKKNSDSPDRLHYFDLTHAILDENHSSGAAVCLLKISSEEDAASSNAKAGGMR